MLCPTSTASWQNSRKDGRTAWILGASHTMAWVMPVRIVMKGGIPVPGLTRVWNVPMTSPPQYLTAPISVISHELADPPVVSRSSTQKVTACSGTPRSSKAIWPMTATPRR
jgi:hypothetical protein